MRPTFFVAVWALGVGYVAAAPATDGDLQGRAIPAACAKPLPVALAYGILSGLRATPFCTKWLSITTKTVSTTTTSTIKTSTTTTTTTIPIVLATATTTKTTSTTTILSSTITAPEATQTIPATITLFPPVTAITTSTSTSVSTSTTYLFDIENKKKKRSLWVPEKPAKPPQLGIIADQIVSSACSCLATTPTVTITKSISTTTVIVSTSVFVTTSTSTAATITNFKTDVITQTSLRTITPTITITNTATLTSPTTVATQTVTIPYTRVDLQIIDVVITPIELDGCTVGTYQQRYLNIGGNSFEQAGQLCAIKCVAAGKTTCDDFFTQQNLPSGTWDCYLLAIADEVNTNFYCNNPAIGRAAEWM
ncbi:hypothetical protein PT974_06939 [Cladobotryum mycophilum]|uniref:Apple domain-containing protein n=1 Tax=Cladobotryum mycophilum TaxID=491253 RepID=A0ABR0SMY2_9HYPO